MMFTMQISSQQHEEPEEKKGSWMLNGSWNAYVGKNAAVVTRNTTGDRILGC